MTKCQPSILQPSKKFPSYLDVLYKRFHNHLQRTRRHRSPTRTKLFQKQVAHVLVDVRAATDATVATCQLFERARSIRRRLMDFTTENVNTLKTKETLNLLDNKIYRSTTRIDDHKLVIVFQIGHVTFTFAVKSSCLRFANKGQSVQRIVGLNDACLHRSFAHHRLGMIRPNGRDSQAL